MGQNLKFLCNGGSSAEREVEQYPADLRETATDYICASVTVSCLFPISYLNSVSAFFSITILHLQCRIVSISLFSCQMCSAETAIFICLILL